VADDQVVERMALVCAAIRAHLQRYPLAGDTPAGMVANWLPARGYEDAPQLIDAVVRMMVAAGELAPHQLPDGGLLYVRGPASPPATERPPAK
jgi:hypothetical protein